MTLNSRRRWCFISKYDVRWTVSLTILCVWCTICGASSLNTPAPTTQISQTANDVCTIKTKGSIGTAMTTKQNPKCTAVTFTPTLPTTIMTSSKTIDSSTGTAPILTTGPNSMSTMISLITTESVILTTTDMIPTSLLVSLSATTAPPTVTDAATTTNLTSTLTASSTTETTTTVDVNLTTTLIPPETTSTDVTATTVSANTTTPSSATEAFKTTYVEPNTTPAFPEYTTAPQATESAGATIPPSTTETSTSTILSPTITLIPPETTSTDATPATTLSSTSKIAEATFVTPTTTLISSEATTGSATSTTTTPSATTEISTDTIVPPTITLISSEATTTVSATTTTLSSTSETFKTPYVEPIATPAFPEYTTALQATESAGATIPSSTTETSTSTVVSPTITLIPTETTTTQIGNATSTTTETSTATVVTPITTHIFSENTTINVTPTTVSSTIVSFKTIDVNPNTIPAFPVSTTAPQATENAGATTAFSTNDIHTTTLISLETRTASTTNVISVTTDGTPTSESLSSAHATAPSTSTNAALTASSTSEGYTTTSVTSTRTLIPSEITATNEASIYSTSLASLNTTNIYPTITPDFKTTTKTGTATTFVTPTTMPMFSEITTSFLAATSLQNATTNSVTSIQISDTQKPTVSITSPESTMIVTQETTISLPVSTTDSTQRTTVPMTSATVATNQTTAVITSRLLFDSSSPVPSEALVLSTVKSLLNSRESQLNQSVKIVNVTYEKLSDTSYALIFTIKLIIISMPENYVLKNNNYKQVEDSINNALNTLLNEPTSAPLQPKTSNFTSTSIQIEGIMGYTFQDKDAIQPVSFLNELRTQTAPTTTMASFTDIAAISISGTAVITSRLMFSSSSPVPSETLVLNAVSTLLNSRESQLNDSVKVVIVTYEKISESSYAVTFKFNIIQLSMPNDSGLRNNTYLQVEDIVNKALNTLVNEPNGPTLKPKSSNFKSTFNNIEGSMEYVFPKDDVLQPISFLHQLHLLTVTTTTSSLTTTTTSPPTLMGMVTIFIKLQFITLSPIPSESSIIPLVNSLVTTRFQTKDATTQNMNVSYVDVTYNKISDSSYVLIFEFKISNVPMYETFGLRNETYIQIQNSINNLLPKVLNDPTPPQIELNQVVFDNSNNEIQANVQFVFSQSNINTSSSLVKEILKANGDITTTAPALTTASTLLTTSPRSLLGKVIMYISLVFKTKGTLPSQSSVLQMANSLLFRLKLKSKRSITEKDLQDLVNGVNVTYTKLDDTSFSLNFGFEIANITMYEKVELRNDTYIVIQTYINSFVSKILNKTTTVDFNFNQIAFISNSSTIEANVTYVFSDSDVGAFGLVASILGATTTPAPTTTYPTVLNTTISSNSTNAAWVVAIIVPCAIVIMLVPCWILLCCLLCGCCTAIRRRWHRRQSYNMQYTSRNSIF